MKIALTGKGGVGKTLVAATLSRLLARDGYKVLAIDADPNLNLGYSLGFNEEQLSKIIPLAENEELIKERTSISPEASLAGFFKLYPKVDDIVDKFGIIGPDNVSLLIIGTVRKGGEGCLCPENAFLRTLIQYILIKRKEFVIIDMEAGIEHLARGTAKGVDIMLIVIEPSYKSIETALRIKKLANDIGIKKIFAITNKVSNENEEEFILKEMNKINIPLLGVIPFDKEVAYADIVRKPLIDHSPLSPVIKAINEVKNKILKIIINDIK
ncbi:MAG: carbon monoxide dehydrogenase accessory protein CooC [Nitrososphaerota archaeon]